MAANLEPRIAELRQLVAANHGRNVAAPAFARRVDELISVFYDDIGEIIQVDLKSLFDLFLLKVLYVQRQSSDAQVLEYLGGMMSRFLYTRELFPIVHGRRRFGMLVSDILEETSHQPRHFQNRFEAYRKFGDYSLFLTGIFPASMRRSRAPGRLRRSPDLPLVDQSYYVTFGKGYYRLAASHELAEEIQQRPVLEKLASFFEIYMQALTELSERYIMGFDMQLIADKMLDNFNLYRRTGDEHYMDNARKYAALLKVDRSSFPRLWRQHRPALLD